MPVNISMGNIAERMRRMFMDNAVSINSAENIIVIKTLPGLPKVWLLVLIKVTGQKSLEPLLVMIP